MAHSAGYIGSFDMLLKILQNLPFSEYTMAPTKSPKTASFSLSTSPFTKDQILWVLYKFGELKNIKKVQRAFRLEFCPPDPKMFPTTWLSRGLLTGLRRVVVNPDPCVLLVVLQPPKKTSQLSRASSWPTRRPTWQRPAGTWTWPRARSGTF